MSVFIKVDRDLLVRSDRILELHQDDRTIELETVDNTYRWECDSEQEAEEVFQAIASKLEVGA